jgi:catechol 2,3-dioxygenase-like lactoylglutathione lyase family enzyme
MLPQRQLFELRLGKIKEKQKIKIALGLSVLCFCLSAQNKQFLGKEKNMLKMDAVGLFVNDMPKMVTFYKDVMGMQTQWNGDANAELFSGDMRLIMYSRKDFEKMTARPYSYPSGLNGTLELSFSLPRFADVDTEYNRTVASGAVPIFPPTDEPWGQRTCYVADPDGNLIEISSFNQG